MNLLELEKIADRLNQTSNRMSENLKDIQEKLNHLNLGVQCFITIENIENNVKIGYSRFNKHWCLTIKKDNEQWSLLQAPRYLRILSIQHIPTLIEAMIVATEAAIIKTEKSAKVAKMILESMSWTSSRLEDGKE